MNEKLAYLHRDGKELPYPLNYASHLPILTGIGKSFPIRRVLEYGSGVYSTPLFLNRDVFPDLRELVSIEVDACWRDTVQQKVGENPRLILSSTDIPYPSASDFDLIFIDSATYEGKIETIRKVAQSFKGIVVVHDSDVEAYMREIESFPWKQNFTKYVPETCVANSVPLDLSKVEKELEEWKWNQ